MKKERLLYLDFIRAFSVFCIIVFHFNCSIGPGAHGLVGPDVHFIFYDYINGSLAHIGVALFFIISGVSLMYNYSDNFDIKKYYKNRWLGIFPMFYLAWIIGMLYYFYTFKTINPFGIQRENWSIIFTILGIDGYVSVTTPNFYILGEWFLGAIIILYLVFPLLLFISKKIGTEKLLVLSLILYIVIVETYQAKIPVDMNAFTRIFDFVFGMFIADKVKKIKWYAVVPAFAVLIVWFNVFIDINIMYKISIFGIALFIVLMYIGQLLNGRGQKIFGKISKYSYAIFLCHHIILDQLCTHFEGPMYDMIGVTVMFIICIVFIAVMSKILYKLNDCVVNWIKNPKA